MKREIIRIDEALCDGCGACIINCPEGALQIIDGKAKLVKESYCDGLGACIGKCPLGAITIEVREADDFDEEAANENMRKAQQQESSPVAHGCPGSAVRSINTDVSPFSSCPGSSARQMDVPDDAAANAAGSQPSMLSHWPVQLTLVQPQAPFLRGAELLLVADCVPFAFADFHSRFLRGHPVIIACPKLDDINSYILKMQMIFKTASLKSLTIIHMEVPCCSGLNYVVQKALDTVKTEVEIKEIIIGIEGGIISEKTW